MARGGARRFRIQSFAPTLQTAVNLALTGQNGVEGGVWQAEAGSLAYAFPTYPGTGPKTDLPAAERDHIQAVNDQAAREEQPIGRRSVTRGQNLLLCACPLPGPIPRLTAWTMTRVESVPEYDRLRLGLAVLLGFMVLMAAWLGRVLILWARYVSGVEAALSAAGIGGSADARTDRRARTCPRRRGALGSRPAARIGASAIGGARGAGLARRVAGDRHPRPHHCVGSVGCGRDLRLARKRVRQRHRQVGRRRDLRRRAIWRSRSAKFPASSSTGRGSPWSAPA